MGHLGPVHLEQDHSRLRHWVVGGVGKEPMGPGSVRTGREMGGGYGSQGEGREKKVG